MDRNLRIRMLLEAGDKVTKPLRDIAAGSSRAAQALKATRDRLKEIERAQAGVAGFRELKAGLRSTETELRLAQGRVGDLARKMAEAGTPTKKLAADFAKAKREASALKDSFDGQNVKLQQLRDRLSAAGVSTSSLAAHERRLRTEAARTNDELREQERRLTGLADRSRRFAAARESFGRVQGTATGLAAGGASAIGVGASLGRPLIEGVQQASAFEASMTTIAQKANLTRREATALGKQVLTVARATNQLPTAIQEGMDTLSGFGLDPRRAAAMMQPIGRAATAYKAEVTDLSKAAFAANDNLKVPIEQTARVIDIMATAGKAGAFEIKDMAGSFPALTAGYQALGQTGLGAVADLSAALQIARKGAGDSETAATNVANIIQKIASPQTIKAFAKFGIDLPAALKKAYDDGKTPLEAIAELTKKATGGDLGKIGFLFEDAQVQQGLRPIIQNLEEYRRIRAEAGAASGTSDKDYAERLKDTAEKTKRLSINAQALGVTLGGQLLPTVNAVSDKIASAAERINAWAQRNPGLSKTLMIAAAVLAGLFVVLGIGGIAIAAIMGPIAILNSGLLAMGVSGGLASIGLLPIIATVVGVIAVALLLAGAAYLIYKNWDAITGFFSGIWNRITNAFNIGLTWLKGMVPTFKSIGAMMLEGLLSMLSPGRLMKHIWNMGVAAIGAFKKVLGIQSPSRVFAALGGHVTGGLALGIDRGGAAPVQRLTRLSRRMTAAIAVGAAMPAMAGTTGGASARPAIAAGAGQAVHNEYHFHIVQQPGQDAHALAVAVRAEIERIKREEAARARASFADKQDWSDHA
ncbi:phage tail tape measure protein [Sphingomonas sp. HMP6]|uniref:phage tail tape measure protein n=1 Tax=Sphingomonas sp. HMP6 TaxID=1517551 RepID=UPI00159AA0F8|nr:phage tail tape measure protein [Sphingomonas sp. HMP6]BCA60230.1 hypothetical protein HMP06_2999 [Sphingomonas sp. HMP6]